MTYLCRSCGLPPSLHGQTVCASRRFVWVEPEPPVERLAANEQELECHTALAYIAQETYLIARAWEDGAPMYAGRLHACADLARRALDKCPNTQKQGAG